MSDALYVPGLSHFENGNGWSGSCGVLCYEIEPPLEGQLRCCLWYGPFRRDYAEQTDEQLFPVSAQGLAALAAWLQACAEQMNTHPQKSPADCRAYYEKLRG